MTDEALKRAYRLMTASPAAAGLPSASLPSARQAHAAAPITADSLSALANGDYAEAARDAHLAAVAESAQNADLLRALRSLASDANALSADVGQVNTQIRTRPLSSMRPALRPARWYALAASVAVAGVVGLVMKATVGVESMPSDRLSAVVAGTSPELEASHIAAGGKIMMASFEDNAASAGAVSSKPTIFVGDFDS